MSKKSERLARSAEIWRIITREKILAAEMFVLDEEENPPFNIQEMWDCVTQCDEMLVPIYVSLIGWPLERRLPHGVDKRRLGSMLRNALTAWVMDDSTLRTWHEADRPALYLYVTTMLQMTSYSERAALVKASMEWAIEMQALKDPGVLEALVAGMAEAIHRAAEEQEKEKRRKARAAKKQAQATPTPST